MTHKPTNAELLGMFAHRHARGDLTCDQLWELGTQGLREEYVSQEEQLNEANRKIAELQEQLTALRNQDDNYRQEATVQDEISRPYDPEGSIPDGWLCGDLYNEVKRLQYEENGVAWNHSTKAQAWTKIQKHHRKYRTDHGGEWPAGKLLVKDDGQRIFKQDDGTYLGTIGQLLVAS